MLPDVDATGSNGRGATGVACSDGATGTGADDGRGSIVDRLVGVGHNRTLAGLKKKSHVVT